MIKPAKKKRYDWPAPVEPGDYTPRDRNPIHSILTALPVIMLIVGLYVYYQGESEQSDNAPIKAESIDAQGVFTGLSVVNSGSQGRHYLWFKQGEKSRGVRVQPEQAAVLAALQRDKPLTLRMAPSVSGSGTYWAWYVEQDGTVFLDTSQQLQ